MMEDSFEHNIKDTLSNPPEFDFNDKPWIIAKSKIDQELKFRRYGKYLLVLTLLLVALSVLLTSLWYNNIFNGITQSKENSFLQNSKNKQTEVFADTVFKETYVYIHDTVTKTIYVHTEPKPVNYAISYTPGFSISPLSLSLSLFANNRFEPSKPNYFANSDFAKNSRNAILGINSFNELYVDYLPASLNSLNTNLKINKLKNFSELPSKLMMLKSHKKATINDLLLYNKWLRKLTNKVAKEKQTPRYKINRFFNGFKIAGYEIEPSLGTMMSIVLSKPQFGVFTGIDSKILFKNRMKFTAGINWTNFQGEFKVKDISENDFAPVPETNGFYDGLHWDNSYLLLPVGFEYHFVSKNSIYPFLGAGMAIKFNNINTLNYEFHTKDGDFEEYKIIKSFNEPTVVSNYWLKTGLNYDFNYHFGSSFEVSYLWDKNSHDYNFLKMRAFIFALNSHYRF